MDFDKIFNALSTYRKPMSIVALVIVVLLFILKKVLSLPIFASLSEGNTFLILDKIITWIFYFALIIALLGFSTYLIKFIINSKTKNSDKIQIGIGVVENDNSVLLVKRRTKEGRLLWQFPAGMIKPTENAESVTIKEIKKETNINCVIIQKIGERIHPDTNVKCYYYQCKYLDGDLKNLDVDENSEVKWVEKKLIKDYITSDLYPEVTKLLGT